MALEPSLEARWTRFWRTLGHSLVPLGRLWALLGGSWLLSGSPELALGTYLAALGHLLAGLGRLLEGFWAPGPPRAFILKGFGVFRGRVFRRFLLFLALCYLMLFVDAVTIIFAFTVAIFLFFRCGGLCAAHGIRRTALQCPGVSDQCAFIYKV